MWPGGDNSNGQVVMFKIHEFWPSGTPRQPSCVLSGSMPESEAMQSDLQVKVNIILQKVPHV
jgi:hypothetical protein